MGDHWLQYYCFYSSACFQPKAGCVLNQLKTKNFFCHHVGLTNFHSDKAVALPRRSWCWRKSFFWSLTPWLLEAECVNQSLSLFFSEFLDLASKCFGNVALLLLQWDFSSFSQARYYKHSSHFCLYWCDHYAALLVLQWYFAPFSQVR